MKRAPPRLLAQRALEIAGDGDKAQPRFLIKVLVFWVIFISSGVLSGISVIFEGASSLLLVPSYVFVAWTVLTRPKRVALSFAHTPLIVAYILWAFSSMAWSIEPSVTMVEAGRLTLTCLTAVSIVSWVGTDRTIGMLAGALTLGCVLSILSIAMPSVSIGEFGDFRGVFQQKNLLGLAAAVCVIVSFYFILYIRVSVVRIAGVVAGLTCIILSDSASSLVMIVMSLSFMGLVWSISHRGYRLNNWILFGAVAIILSSGVVGQLYMDDILAILGRNSTFTGRLQLWNVGEALISYRPMLGYGYQVLSYEYGYLAVYLVQTVGPYALQFHQSWINIQFQLGYLGLLFNALCFLYIFVLAFREQSLDGFRGGAVLLVSVGISFVLQSITESTFGAPRSTQTFLMVVLFLRHHEAVMRRVSTAAKVSQK